MRASVKRVVAIADATVTLPSQGDEHDLYLGTQVVRRDGSVVYEVDQPAASARVEGPRFTIRPAPVGSPDGFRAEVLDSNRIVLTNLDSELRATATVTSVRTGRKHVVIVPGGASRTVVDGPAPALPNGNLALGALTYPDSPLEPSATSPALAVDGSRRRRGCRDRPVTSSRI